MRFLFRVIHNAAFLVAVLFSLQSLAEEIIYDAPEKRESANQPPPPAEGAEVKAAQDNSLAAVAPEKQKEMFSILGQEIAKDPNNLDKYFEYAQLATALGELKKSATAYKHMIDVDPQLHRVKLELALVYMRLGKFKDAKQLFENVLSTNPPDSVKKNIEQMLQIVNNALKPDVFSGSVSTGYNIDSNANSAASSGQTTFVDTSIPLSLSSRASRDGHLYGSAAIAHTHRFDIDNDIYKLSFDSGGVVYKTYQDTEHSLDIGLASIKAGPVIEFPDLKTRINVDGTMSILDLNGNRYLKTRSWGSGITYALLDNLVLNTAYNYEYRKFINTLTTTSYADRSGNANQQDIGATYALTPLDVFNTNVSWRYENAFSQVYGNTQSSITGGYTRQLPWDLSANAVYGFKKTNYHQPDPLVNAAVLRHDRERSMTYTLAKKLPYNVIATTAYQYKNVTSNVQNNDYENHRYSVGMGWSF